MAVLRFRHVESWKDRHGHVRHYFRKGHGKRVMLPGEPGSEEFMAAYSAAQNMRPTVQVKATQPGSFAALFEQYLRSPNYLKNAEISRDSAKRVMEKFIADHGHRMVTQMTRAHVETIVGERAETPAAANTLLKRIRTLINYSIALGWRPSDPTRGIPKFKEGEFHTWSEEEISLFEAKWPMGTKARTGFALALYTGQRRADVSRMTWGDIQGGVIRVVQGKTGTELFIPLHPNLAAVLAKWPRTADAIIASGRRKAHTVESFGNLMADAIGDAGLPAICVLHGLRKAAARRLAEVGCSASQIASITGHKSLSEVERYTRAAEQRRMAGAAMTMLSAQGFGESENIQGDSMQQISEVGRLDD